MNPPLSAADVSRIVEMAWEDRTSFDAIERAGGATVEGQPDRLNLAAPVADGMHSAIVRGIRA